MHYLYDVKYKRPLSQKVRFLLIDLKFHNMTLKECFNSNPADGGFRVMWVYVFFGCCGVCVSKDSPAPPPPLSVS